MHGKLVPAAILISILALNGSIVAAQQPPPPPPGGGGPNNADPPTFDLNFQAAASTYSGVAVISMGEGEFLSDDSLTSECPAGGRFESGASGTVTAEDGSEWIVPMEVNPGPGTVDIFNDCIGSGDNPDFLNELETIVIDEGGTVVTAFIFADNYFEIYVNGQFIGRDNINFIPFNSTAVRFQANYPMTIAVHMADWETHYGIGMEYDSYNVGDGGFIAWFDNGAITNEDWKVLPLYIAPLDDPGCVIEDEFGNADASGCSIKPECSTQNADVCRALHYETPEGWEQPGFDDSNWQNATLYNAEDVTNQPGYANYAAAFVDARFIWSPSLKLDNSVLARYTIQAP